MSKNWTWGEICKMNIDHLRDIVLRQINCPFVLPDTLETLEETQNFEEKLAWFSEVKYSDIISQFQSVMEQNNMKFTEIKNMNEAVEDITYHIKDFERVNDDILWEVCYIYLVKKGLIKDE